MTAPTVSLGLSCSGRCIFCAQRGAAAEIDRPDVTAALRTLADSHDAVMFVGGEPTERPELRALVDAARGEGFERVGLQTHGRHVADPERVQELVSAGLTDVHLSIHGARPEIHDYHTAIEGSFAAVTRAVEHLRAAGVTVVATSVITRSNYRDLAELAGWIADRGIEGWALGLVRVAGATADGFDRIVPRLGMALPYALHAATAARNRGVAAWIRGAPVCALGPHAGFRLPSSPRQFPAPCSGCAAREQCPGVDAAYTDRFGTEELRPLDRQSVARPSAAAPRLQSLFVGTGTLAARTATPHESPAAARRRLPVLGKVQRATDEVAPSADRRSGDSLRTLFPDLFADDDPHGE